ncbi:uncharacterized protein LOC143203816 isoform X3 [Rhynchophorus ferrugineus]|uniref:uncharacterized protein LOC143203816 isoform X3 n=2 Tax=Rhynchophorus ferrugineus TaxID=354439 RepID=UPI003FCDE228
MPFVFFRVKLIFVNIQVFLLTTVRSNVASLINMKKKMTECRTDVDSSPNDVICLLDDEEDGFQQYKEKSKQTLHYLLDTEPENEYKFIETIEKYRLILETQVDSISNTFLKETATNDIIYITINYKKIAALYVDNYLDVMEEILIILCNVIRNYFRNVENFTAKIIKKESRRIKTLLQWSLLDRLDRIMHLFLKIQITTDLHEYKMLWADIFRYYLSRVFQYLKNEEIVGGYIIYQKLKDLTPKKEWTRIDLCVYRTLGKTINELRKIPILKEIIEKREMDPLYSVRDMCVQYYKYYKRRCSDVFRASYKQNLKPISLFNENHSTIFDNSPPFYSILSHSSSCFDKVLAQRKTAFGTAFQVHLDHTMISPVNPVIVSDDEDPVIVLESDDDVQIISEPSPDHVGATITTLPSPNDQSDEPLSVQDQITESSIHTDEEPTVVSNNDADEEPPDKLSDEVLSSKNNEIVNEEVEEQEKASSIYHGLIQETDAVNSYLEDNFEYPSYYSENNCTSISDFNEEPLDIVPDLLLNNMDVTNLLNSCDETESPKSDMKLPLPLKKRPVIENTLSTTIITTPMDLISYPAERQMSIADLQNEFPRIRTLAARKYYPDDDTHSPCQPSYCNSSSQSIMDVYINGFNQCSDYPICFMIGSMKTCLNHALTSNCHHKQDFLTAPQNSPIDASQVLLAPPPMIDKL